MEELAASRLTGRSDVSATIRTGGPVSMTRLAITDPANAVQVEEPGERSTLPTGTGPAVDAGRLAMTRHRPAGRRRGGSKSSSRFCRGPTAAPSRSSEPALVYRCESTSHRFESVEATDLTESAPLPTELEQVTS